MTRKEKLSAFWDSGESPVALPTWVGPDGQSIASNTGAETAMRLAWWLTGAALKSLNEASPGPATNSVLASLSSLRATWAGPGTQSHCSLSPHSGFNHLCSTMGHVGPNALV